MIQMLPTKFRFIWPSDFRDIFRNQPIRNKNCLWWPCLLTDRDEMNNIYRGHDIDASYQVSVHLAKRFQRRSFFKNRPIRNKNCLWWPCLLMDQDKMSNLQRGPAIDASYQVSLHLAVGFQRRRLKCEKLTDDRRRTPSDGKNTKLPEQFQNLEKQKNPTLSEQFQNLGKQKNTTLSEQFQNLEKQNNTTVGTVPKSNRKAKNTTLSEQI